jgi:hypothetical protein
LIFEKAVFVTLKVVGAGVGRTGTNSLKIALERLLGGQCHHMFEIIMNPDQVPLWTAAIEQKGDVDWTTVLDGYVAQVDWPGASFWPELSAAYPDALVILSVRDPDVWYTSASNTIFQSFDLMPPELSPWFANVAALLAERFSAELGDRDAMIAAYKRHNDAVRAAIPADRLLEWSPEQGWEPICERLDVPVPDEPFPITNQTAEFRAMMGAPPL